MAKIASLLIIPLAISGFLWPDAMHGETKVQTILWGIVVGIFIIFLALYLTMPLWNIKAKKVEETEPEQMYRVSFGTDYTVSEIIRKIGYASGTNIKVYQYYPDNKNTIMQFSAKGLRNMSSATFLDPVAIGIPKFIVTDGYLGLTGGVPFSSMVVDYDKLYVYYPFGIGVDYPGSEDVLTSIMGESLPVPLGREPGYNNGKFEDNVMVFVTSIPKDTLGLEFRLGSLGSEYGCGNLEISINGVWYKLYQREGAYYSSIRIVGGVAVIDSPVTKYLKKDFSCLCPNSTFNGKNTYKIKYTFTNPDTNSTKVVYSKNQSCQLSPIIDLSFLRELADTDIQINMEQITKDIAQRVCPDYYKKCQDDPNCVMRDLYDVCKDEGNCDMYPPVIETTIVDWGPDPQDIPGDTSLEKLEKCIGQKAFRKYKEVDDCEWTKKMYSDCKIAPITDGGDSANQLGIFVLRLFFEPFCIVKHQGLGIKEDDNTYLRKKVGTDIDFLGQVQQQCCDNNVASPN